MNNDTTSSVQIPEASTNDVLAGILRDGARQMLSNAIEAEVADYIATHAHPRATFRPGYRALQTEYSPRQTCPRTKKAGRDERPAGVSD